jgi:hypothetical protein
MSTSSRPKAHSCGAHDSGQRGHIEQVRRDDGGRLRAPPVQLIAQLFRFVDRLATMNADVGAVRVKTASKGSADAPGGARDQDDAAGQDRVTVRGVQIRHVRHVR